MGGKEPNRERATDAQLQALEELGLEPSPALSKDDANLLIRAAIGCPTSSQERFLRRQGEWQDGMTGREAEELIRQIRRAGRGWR